MINWPKTLVTEIVQRRCIFFLGAGVAASSTNLAGGHPKEWKGFLTEASALVILPANRAIVTELISQNKLLLALQAISNDADPADYQNLLNQNFNDPTFEPSKLHQVIFDLDSRLVITTNFDKIYEKLCLRASTEGFKVIPYYSTSFGDELRSDTRLIIKAHGSIDELQKMIFTKSQYHTAKEMHSSFYSILKGLLLTNTCIFVGCSLDDPDVLLLLEDVKITASPNRPHYALLREGSHNHYAKHDLLSCYNVKALEYGPNHSDLVTDLTVLLENVYAVRAIP